MRERVKNHIKFLLISVLFLGGCAQRFPRIEIPISEPPAKKMDRLRPKVALVLGSGSARGFAHAGVLKVLQENNIPIDLIVGTSAGSIVGALYADNPNARELERALLTAKRTDVIDFSFFNIYSGPVSGAGLQNFLMKHLRAKTFDQLAIPFVAVAADLGSGKTHAFKSGPIIPAVNASSAAPPFFRPVKLYGRTYVDGGLTDPVAVDVAKEFHPKIIIAVKLDYPLSTPIPLHSLGVFLRSVDIMLLRLHKANTQAADVVICPKVGQVDMFQDKGRSELIKAGEIAARKALPEIKRLLKSRGIN